MCGRSSAGRALASQASDRGFEPRRPLQNQLTWKMNEFLFNRNLLEK